MEFAMRRKMKSLRPEVQHTMHMEGGNVEKEKCTKKEISKIDY